MYAKGVINIDSQNNESIKILEIILESISDEIMRIATDMIRDKIFNFFLSFLLIYGFSSVSAGAYNIIKIKLIRKRLFFINNGKSTSLEAYTILKNVNIEKSKHVQLFLACIPAAKVLIKEKLTIVMRV